MGVRINSSKTYKTPVNFETIDAAGKKENQSYIAEFKRMTQDEIIAMREECKDDRAMAKRVLAGWTMEDEAKAPFEFNDENLETVCNNIAGFAGVTVLRFAETVGANRTKT